MKSVCSIHTQAYDVGERCPYCEEPQTEPERLNAQQTGPIDITTADGGWAQFNGTVWTLAWCG